MIVRKQDGTWQRQDRAEAGTKFAVSWERLINMLQDGKPATKLIREDEVVTQIEVTHEGGLSITVGKA